MEKRIKETENTKIILDENGESLAEVSNELLARVTLRKGLKAVSPYDYLTSLNEK